jgi:DNA-binding protein HU-beta
MAVKTAVTAKSKAAAKPKAAAKAAAPTAKSNVVAKSKAAAKPAAPSKAAAPVKMADAPKKAAPVITLKQLAVTLADRQDMAPKQASLVLGSLVELMVEHLKQGDRLRIGGLGVLEVKDRPARMGRNPATGAAVQIQASKKIAFRAAKELKEAI